LNRRLGCYRDGAEPVERICEQAFRFSIAANSIPQVNFRTRSTDLREPFTGASPTGRLATNSGPSSRKTPHLRINYCRPYRWTLGSTTRFGAGVPSFRSPLELALRAVSARVTLHPTDRQMSHNRLSIRLVWPRATRWSSRNALPVGFYPVRNRPRKWILYLHSSQQSSRNDVAFGWQLAKEMGSFDIGHTVAVCEPAGATVEGSEGNDQTFHRAKRLHRTGDFVVVKTAKRLEDNHIDAATVGCAAVPSMGGTGDRVPPIEPVSPSSLFGSVPNEITHALQLELPIQPSRFRPSTMSRGGHDERIRLARSTEGRRSVSREERFICHASGISG
jgi:UDP-2,3-diacylglucosamine hydrolase LpxI-like protein